MALRFDYLSHSYGKCIRQKGPERNTQFRIENSEYHDKNMSNNLEVETCAKCYMDITGGVPDNVDPDVDIRGEGYR